MTSTQTPIVNETERLVIETTIQRLAALRDRANTESHLLSITPTSRKHKADLGGSRVGSASRTALR